MTGRVRVFAILAVFTLVVAVIAVSVLFPTYKITTGAMEPTFEIGDRVITTRSFEPQRGDVVVFSYAKAGDAKFAKRIVALPGETVMIRAKRLSVNGVDAPDHQVQHSDRQVYPDNPSFPEPYRSRDHFGPVTVPDSHFFVLGDNRDASADSRYRGPVRRADIYGKVVFVISASRGLRRP